MRVSLVCFSDRQTQHLDGTAVPTIFADLTADTTGRNVAAPDLTLAKVLAENAGVAFSGIQKTGPFEVSGELARRWLLLPNPHGRSNAEVVKPWSNGLDITRRNRDMWIMDFGVGMPETEAALFDAPFAYAHEHVRPTRVGKREARTNEMWWIFQWSRPVMRAAIKHLPRIIVTPEVSRYRLFTGFLLGLFQTKTLWS